MEIRVILLLIFYPLFGISQNLEFRAWNGATSTYGAAQTFPAEGVADDFGYRRFGPPNWHGGISADKIKIIFPH